MTLCFIDNGNVTDPRENLALEEYTLNQVDMDRDYLLFYVNEPSVIIGRHQNTYEEVNHAFVEERGIHVVRRISGGGAVYHDLGNLNFSFLTRYTKDRFSNYARFTEPVIRVLNALGVEAAMAGRNDISVEGRKVSGNAQYVWQGRMLSHGTLLYQTNLEDVARALTVRKGKIESKGIKSVRSRVANIAEFLKDPMDIRAFKALLLEGIFEGRADFPRHRFKEEDLTAVRILARDKYGSHDWNYGASPDFNFRNARRFPSGEIEVRLFVQEGKIQSARIYGDFFSIRDVSELEALLTGAAYRRDVVEGALRDADFSQYFAGVEEGEFLDLLW